MRRALALFAFFACLAPRHADAQQALGQNVTLPNGVTVARACDKLMSEGVLVASIDERSVPAQDSLYFAQLAQVIARRVDVRAGDPPRASTYGALLMHNGSLGNQIPVVQSGSRELDTRIGSALALSSRDADVVAAPADMPDSLRVLVTFGQHTDGSTFVASHVRCPAMPYPDNPAHTMPAWTLGHRRTVIVRGVITPAGRVDTATAQVDDPSDERYAEAAMSAVAEMRFVPAEFDGTKVPAPIEIEVPFGAPESADSASRP
ncbi:MAG TPA: energy transducer TonB [Gemmatimonadaceae bacterium]|nr:energy transducer TonB [Gemmatimonadaceae bacterium]